MCEWKKKKVELLVPMLCYFFLSIYIWEKLFISGENHCFIIAKVFPSAVSSTDTKRKVNVNNLKKNNNKHLFLYNLTFFLLVQEKEVP